MKAKKTLLLTRKDIEGLLDMPSILECVEKSFLDHAKGKTQMPPKIYLNLPQYDGDFRAMPAYVESSDACVLKWVNVHTGNEKKGLPTVMAVVVLSDPRTGFPLAIMDGTAITNYRTGASGGVAAKYLAPEGPCVVGLVGCGQQARTQLMAIREVRKVKRVYVWGHRPTLIKSFIKDMAVEKQEMIAASTIEECVMDADIVVTTTPSRKPLVKLEWLKKKVHINAIGADAKGKQELEINILKNSKIVIDDWEQASHSGEINDAVRGNRLSRQDIYANLGEIVAKKLKGRTEWDEMTVFDSTGLAIQDAVVAKHVYKLAEKKGVGKPVSLV